MARESKSLIVNTAELRFANGETFYDYCCRARDIFSPGWAVTSASVGYSAVDVSTVGGEEEWVPTTGGFGDVEIRLTRRLKVGA